MNFPKLKINEKHRKTNKPKSGKFARFSRKFMHVFQGKKEISSYLKIRKRQWGKRSGTQNNAAIGNKSQSTSQDKGLAKRMMVMGKKLRDIWHLKEK